ncbi:MAG: diol dehydratase reactivase ATPase-like domain-containing protein [bacterium]
MNEIMALDIGTGTVIGYIARCEDGQLDLIARDQLSYEKRAVEEGRVVDIGSAVNTVKQVVSNLCSSAKTNLRVAHFAVPGCGLKVREIEASYRLDKKAEITPEHIQQLYRRQRPLVDDCVVIDEEVVKRGLDGEEVINFRGQYGAHLEIKWLVTTLSRDEIINKRKIIEESGLIPGQLVLEPRAAVEAAFPNHEFRPRMGVIDFGAGTIDAALLEEGKIRDFCTLVGSGDRLTRRLEELLLVDFKRAEDIKQAICHKSEITFKNLAGETGTVTESDIVGWLSPLLQEELEPLKKWFKERPPWIIFITGGGSQFPFLPRLLANMLKIKETSIITRPPGPRPGVYDGSNLLSSSADYTAYGVLLLAAAERGRYDLEITVNGQSRERLVRGPEYTVSDLLADTGHHTRKPHPDAVKMVCVDGNWETKKREERLEPYVEVNGEQASFDLALRSGDNVLVEAAEKPQPVRVFARDFLPDEELTVKFKDHTINLPPRLKDSSGRFFEADEELEDGVEYESCLYYSRREIIEAFTEAGIEMPEECLWIKNKYSEKEQFKVGQKVVLEPAVSPEDFGLGRLTYLPSPPDRALQQNLR